ncbi:MAG: hypothetical protein HXS47_06930 [Theionarchaea archaeon]|nr:hypothetical protein [Theionarchaea archaeon]
MDRILKVFCGEEVSCVEEWAKKRKAPQELLTRMYQSLTDPQNAHTHVEHIFDLFENEKDEHIKNKIRMALVRIQMFSHYHMFEQSEFRDAGDMASLLERMLFGYNITEGKKPQKDEASSEE